MSKTIIAGALSLVALGLSLPAAAQERLAAFQGGIGSQPFARQGAAPAGGGPGTIIANDVRRVPPGGRPWVIADLRADIRVDGTIRVDGRGLLLAGGDNTGRNGGQSVRARLFCNGTAPTFADATEHQTDPVVPLEANGDFRIDDTLEPSVPAVCANAVLLIVSGGGNWFAAGIPKE